MDFERERTAAPVRRAVDHGGDVTEIDQAEPQDFDEGETGAEDSGVSVFLDRFFTPVRRSQD